MLQDPPVVELYAANKGQGKARETLRTYRDWADNGDSASRTSARSACGAARTENAVDRVYQSDNTAGIVPGPKSARKLRVLEYRRPTQNLAHRFEPRKLDRADKLITVL